MRFRLMIAATLVVAGCAGAPDNSAPEPIRTSVKPNPIAGKAFYDDQRTQVDALLAQSPRGTPEAKAMELIAARPAASWLTGRTGEAETVRRVTKAAAMRKNTVALLVFYNQPRRDACSGSSGGGAADKGSFLRWNEEMIEAMQGKKTAVVVFAPDALVEVVRDCLTGAAADERVGMFAEALAKLARSPQVALTCLDAGHPDWVPASDDAAMAKLVQTLERAGLAHAQCVSLNTSNSVSDARNHKYLAQLNLRINKEVVRGPVGAIIDTSRNGAQNLPKGAWCNVPGRKLGKAPTTSTGSPEVYAYAYIKHPGESDGDGKGCNPGDLPAGQFDPRQAVSLAAGEL